MVLPVGRGVKQLVRGQLLTVPWFLPSESPHRMAASLSPEKAALEGRRDHGSREYLRTSPHRTQL